MSNIPLTNKEKLIVEFLELSSPEHKSAAQVADYLHLNGFPKAGATTRSVATSLTWMRGRGLLHGSAPEGWWV